MTTPDGSALLPVWAVIPAASVLLVVVAAHAGVVRRSPGVPPSRKRIRLANAALMVVTIPVLSFALGVARSDDPRVFVLAWLATVGLIGLVIMVACLDMLNTVRLGFAARRRLREHLSRVRSTLVAGAVRARMSPEAVPGHDLRGTP
ncbi:MAG: hypothetical protein HRU70_02905 [Phycisphaeraceae bacterium]|nr:MAG: hypothetical protein HRU70_02905 [Phycisphaeraceae bacterium]